MGDEFQPIRLLNTLSDHRVRFVLIGGFAGSLRGLPLLTGDLDICYARDQENLEHLCTALEEVHARSRGVDEDVPFQLEPVAIRNGDSFTFVTDLGALDCLAIPSGTSGFEDLNAGAEDIGIGVVTVRVCSLEDLARMKRAANRPKDRVALEWIGGLSEELGAS